MQIIANAKTNEYNHEERTVTRIVSSKIHLVSLRQKLPKSYTLLSELELLNSLTNLDSEDFQALAEYQKGQL